MPAASLVLTVRVTSPVRKFSRSRTRLTARRPSSSSVATDSPDLNGDRQVGIADFAKYAVDLNCYSLGIPCDPCHDFNEDGGTGIADFAIFAAYMNDSVCP